MYGLQSTIHKDGKKWLNKVNGGDFMIFTDRTITVKDNESTIDKKIILYRGDREIEIRFTILDCLFKYRSNGSSNLIETTNASWGQLVIANPAQSKVLISKVAATNEGVVLLNISADMIDGLDELGEYTFQIRLYNEDKTSRVTIPEVIGGIVVKEPLSADVE